MAVTTPTHVVNLRHVALWHHYIGRPCEHGDGYFGNPFPLEGAGDMRDRARCLLRFLDYFEHRMGLRYTSASVQHAVFGDVRFRERVESLRGCVLACYCVPLPCHGDVYVAWLERGNAGLDELRSTYNRRLVFLEEAHDDCQREAHARPR